jgi:hypothetical protein
MAEPKSVQTQIMKIGLLMIKSRFGASFMVWQAGNFFSHESAAGTFLFGAAAYIPI